MDYNYFDYDEEDELELNDYDRYLDSVEEQSWIDIVQICIKPSLNQTVQYIMVMIAANVACRVLWYAVAWTRIGSWLNHVCSVSCGFALLFFMTRYDFLIVLFLCLMAYGLILLVDYGRYKHVGVIVTVTTISSHLIYETIWIHPETWQHIRGIQMVASMKVISLAFDLEETCGNVAAERVPALVPFLGYIFCPANCVLGPWIPYNWYLRSTQDFQFGYRWMLWIVLNTLFAFIFLCLSNCIVPLVCQDTEWKWLASFRDALSVRCSHYFISFVSQTNLAAAGISPDLVKDQSLLFGYMVTKPWNIEIPRSLSSLVRSWNIPMHDWLKNYVFRGLCRKFNSYPLALMGTYIVSSLMHGLHSKVYLVLLSLCLFAHAEQALRLKLANVFNACVSAKSCHMPCKYATCPNRKPRQCSSLTIIWSVNLAFCLMAMLNLAYLGVMLSNPYSSNSESKSFDIKTDLQKWANLDYTSHWIAALTYLFFYLI